jgi:hypothetical protein
VGRAKEVVEAEYEEKDGEGDDDDDDDEEGEDEVGDSCAAGDLGEAKEKKGSEATADAEDDVGGRATRTSGAVAAGAALAGREPAADDLCSAG